MNKVDLSTYTNPEFQPGSIVRRASWWFFSYLFVNTFFPWPMALKLAILSAFGAKLGKKVVVKPKINIKFPWLLEVGDHTWVGENVWIDNLTNVKIGKNACLSQGAMLLTGNHNYKSTTFDLILGEIVLEDGVWVGSQSVVCPGCTMKSHSVLSVGSVLSQDAEAYSIYRGNPAKMVRKREVL